MFSEQLIGNLIQGLVLGSIYGVATMGLSMIFGVLQVVNVGHGAFIMVGATTAEALSHPEVIDVYLGKAPE